MRSALLILLCLAPAVAWAEDREGPLPDAAVEAAVATIAPRLEELGIGPEERARPPRRS